MPGRSDARTLGAVLLRGAVPASAFCVSPAVSPGHVRAGVSRRRPDAHALPGGRVRPVVAAPCLAMCHCGRIVTPLLFTAVAFPRAPQANPVEGPEKSRRRPSRALPVTRRRRPGVHTPLRARAAPTPDGDGSEAGGLDGHGGRSPRKAGSRDPARRGPCAAVPRWARGLFLGEDGM